MNSRNEWYWNLNIHRDQLALMNTKANHNNNNGTRTNLPISSTCYTSAVLTDVGICVGMRNVNLKGENRSYFFKPHKIPNCCSNLNIVGQHNEQTWATAYDRMKYSTLTDPSMAIHSTQMNTFDHYHHHYDEWRISQCNRLNMKNVYNYDNINDSEMRAETNPFHLFGDSSEFSSYNCNCHQHTLYSTNSHLFQPFSTHGLQKPIIPSNDIKFEYGAVLHPRDYYSDYFNHKLNNEHHQPAVFGSSISNAMPSQLSNYHNQFQYDRMDDNVSLNNHVAAPKKKWIRNYMQCNFT